MDRYLHLQSCGKGPEVTRILNLYDMMSAIGFHCKESNILISSKKNRVRFQTAVGQVVSTFVFRYRSVNICVLII